MTLRGMDNVGIVVESLDATISFFTELGLELEGRAMVEGEWAGRVTGLGDQRVEIAMMRTPDGHSRLELSRFLAPPVVADHRNAPVNSFSTKTRIDSATSADPKDSSSASPKSSAEGRAPHRRPRGNSSGLLLPA